MTVCRNPGPQLFEAVESVKGLNDPRITQVIVDGASTDGTVEYLRSLDPSVRWLSEPDGGIYDAMNKGWVASAEGSYVIMVGADDRLFGVPTDDELDAAERAGCAMVFGTTNMGSANFRSRFDAGIRFRNTLHHQSLMVRKDVCNGLPFDVRYRVYGDWDFNLRLWLSGCKAMQVQSLRAYAAPGGASAKRPLLEAFLIARRNLGICAGGIAWAAHLYGRFFRRHEMASPRK